MQPITKKVNPPRPWKPGEELKQVERVNGREIRVGTIDQFALQVCGVRLKRNEAGKYPVLPAGLMLAIEKIREPGHKHYRLIWAGRGQAWLAEEDEVGYRRKREALEAGRRLAGETGAFFDEWTR